jgi:hypothetical protein
MLVISKNKDREGQMLLPLLLLLIVIVARSSIELAAGPLFDHHPRV